MAYSVDWVAKVVFIPSSDLALVSGTRYSLNMWEFLVEIRRLESAFDEGLWAAQVLDHTNPKLDFAGADFAGFDEVLNGYTITFDPAVSRVDLLGSNNDIIDAYNVNGVSIVPSNSAGLQKVTSGSGLSQEEHDRLMATAFLDKIILNKRELIKNGTTWELSIYDDDGVTPILNKALKDKDGNDLTDLAAGVLAQEMASSV